MLFRIFIYSPCVLKRAIMCILGVDCMLWQQQHGHNFALTLTLCFAHNNMNPIRFHFSVRCGFFVVAPKRFHLTVRPHSICIVACETETQQKSFDGWILYKYVDSFIKCLSMDEDAKRWCVAEWCMLNANGSLYLKSHSNGWSYEYVLRIRRTPLTPPYYCTILCLV